MADGELVAALLVGNDQLTEVKLKTTWEQVSWCCERGRRQCAVPAGFGSLGPAALPENVKIIADRKEQRCSQCCCGANEDGYHLTGVNPRSWFHCRIRGYPEVREGEISPDGQGVLNFARYRDWSYNVPNRYSGKHGCRCFDEMAVRIQSSWAVMVSGVSRFLSAVKEQHVAFLC